MHGGRCGRCAGAQQALGGGLSRRHTALDGALRCRHHSLAGSRGHPGGGGDDPRHGVNGAVGRGVGGANGRGGDGGGASAEGITDGTCCLQGSLVQGGGGGGGALDGGLDGLGGKRDGAWWSSEQDKKGSNRI